MLAVVLSLPSQTQHFRSLLPHATHRLRTASLGSRVITAPQEEQKKGRPCGKSNSIGAPCEEGPEHEVVSALESEKEEEDGAVDADAHVDVEEKRTVELLFSVSRIGFKHPLWSR